MAQCINMNPLVLLFISVKIKKQLKFWASVLLIRINMCWLMKDYKSPKGVNNLSKCGGRTEWWWLRTAIIKFKWKDKIL